MGNEVQVTPAQNNNAMMSLKGLTDRVNLVHQVLEKVMKENTHYGTVPGCGNKMVLLKPGADVLAMTFRLVPQFQVNRTDGDNGHREYDVTCSMYDSSGTLLGQGVGSASTMEKKYRYRKDSKGARIENEDIADCYNTVLKIAKKRAHIDATLTVTGAADLFTQDLIEEDDEVKQPIKTPQAKQPPRPGTDTPVNGSDQPESATPATSSNEHKGILKNVSEKSGKTKAGKEWIRYGLELEDGAVFGTFSESIADTAMSLLDSEVIVTFEDDGKHKNATAICPVIS